MHFRRLLLCTVVLAVSGCVTAEESNESSWIPSTPYDKYIHSVRLAGLDESAVVRDWIAAGEKALEGALPIFAPYSQVGFFDPSETRAQAYRIEAYRGQKLIIEFDVTGPDSLKLFIDLFRAPRTQGSPPVHVASADSTSGTLEFVAYWDGAYLLRVQPELLRGGRYQLTVRNGASLEFPVAELNSSAIKSVWGDSRDGGSRNHQGVDIFAPRGTAVVATSKGTVGFVGTNRLGGNVVWLRDAQTSQSLYYAHLEEQAVRRGQRVQPGDTLGFVGNSGNARTTPPHLHFGVYIRGRGAVNPYWYLFEPTQNPGRISANTDRLGQWGRVASNGVAIRESPRSRAAVVLVAGRETPVRILSGTSSWYEVELPDHSSGYVRAGSVSNLDQPIATRLVASGGLVLDAPTVDGVPADSLEPGSVVEVLGRFADFLMVESDRGQTGWIHSADLVTSLALERSGPAGPG
jgi:murein DD-endopeptidase MepM/ murein hydrolase activator NlpD